LLSTLIAGAAQRPNVGWPPFVFVVGLAVLVIAVRAHHRRLHLPHARLMGLAVVALAIVALSALSEAEMGGLGIVDLVAMAAVAASALLLASIQRSDADRVAAPIA
jgi:hypothetical protein